MQDHFLLLFNMHNQPDVPFSAFTTLVVVWDYCFIKCASILVLYELHVLAL